MTKEEKAIFVDKGWITLTHYIVSDELIALANSIGKIVNHPNGQQVYILKATEGRSSIKGTFSNKFGFNEFPLHTDTAFWTRPVRYMILNSEIPSNSFTTILPISDLFEFFDEKDRLNIVKAVFIVKTNKERYYTSLIFTDAGTKGFKYDPTCMIPFNKSAKEIASRIEELSRQMTPFKIKWDTPKTIVVDNWKVLHGRGPVQKNESRMLKRIYINDI